MIVWYFKRIIIKSGEYRGEEVLNEVSDRKDMREEGANESSI